MDLSEFAQVPVIDVGPLVSDTAGAAVAAQIGAACRECGFFYIVGHGVDEKLCRQLEELARQFFAQERNREDADRDVAGRPGVARLFPGRR